MDTKLFISLSCHIVVKFKIILRNSEKCFSFSAPSCVAQGWSPGRVINRVFDGEMWQRPLSPNQFVSISRIVNLPKVEQKSERGGTQEKRKHDTQKCCCCSRSGEKKLLIYNKCMRHHLLVSEKKLLLIYDEWQHRLLWVFLILYWAIMSSILMPSPPPPPKTHLPQTVTPIRGILTQSWGFQGLLDQTKK